MRTAGPRLVRSRGPLRFKGAAGRTSEETADRQSGEAAPGRRESELFRRRENEIDITFSKKTDAFCVHNLFIGFPLTKEVVSSTIMLLRFANIGQLRVNIILAVWLPGGSFWRCLAGCCENIHVMDGEWHDTTKKCVQRIPKRHACPEWIES